MKIKKLILDNNKSQSEKPAKLPVVMEIDYVLSEQFLLSIKQKFRPSKTISTIPLTSDHKIVLDEPQHVTKVEKKDLAAAVPSYYVQPTFNYLSMDWEANLGALSELQSPVIYTQEEGKSSDRSFDTNAINRQFAKNPDSLTKFFRRRNTNEINKHKNILFGAKFEYKRMNFYKRNYPFYIEISLINKTRQEFKTRLKDLGLYELLIEDYIQATKESISFGKQTLTSFDFNQWVNKSDFQIDETNIKILSPSYTKPNNFFYNLKKLNMIGFTRKMIRTHQRKIIEILNKTSAYNEVMFYRFDKYENKTGRLIQSFWLPAEDSVNFIDTQVKYGTI